MSRLTRTAAALVVALVADDRPGRLLRRQARARLPSSATTPITTDELQDATQGYLEAGARARTPARSSSGSWSG